MATVRLIVAQGPTQLLSVISVLKFQKATGEYSDCVDILVVGGFFTEVSYELTQSMIHTCFQIAKIWGFESLHTTYELDCLFNQQKIGFLEALEALRKQIGVDLVDVVYTARNWTFINEVSLAAYPQARKICYGDILGVIDLGSTDWGYQPLNPSGFVKMDDAYLIQPGIEAVKGALDNISTQFIDFEIFKDSIEESAKQIVGLESYCNDLKQNIGEKFSVALLSNCTEASFTKDIDSEINLYLSGIIPFLEQDEILLVKAHPRQTLDQSKKLVQALNKYNIDAVEITEFSQVSIELFTPYIDFRKAITFISSSCVTLAHIQQSEIVVGLGEELIKNYINSNHQIRLKMLHKLHVKLTEQAYKKQFYPIRYEEREEMGKEVSSPLYPLRISSNSLEQDLGFIHPDAQNILLQIQLKYLQRELEKNNQKLQLVQATLSSTHEEFKHERNQLLCEAEKNQIQLAQTKAELAEIRAELHNKQTLESLLHNAHEDLQRSRSKLKQLRGKIHQLQTQLEDAQNIIRAMESSKFWLLRKFWFKLKLFLVRSTQQPSKLTSSNNQNKLVKSPLTGSDQANFLSVLECQWLVEAWQNLFQIDISLEIKNQEKIFLYQCAQTKLKFFLPLDVAGSDKLYKHLEKFDWYYMSDKWEHDVAIKDLDGCQTILEIGAGRGSFVRRVQQSLSVDAQGIELNSNALAYCKAQNIPVFNLDLLALAQEKAGYYDAVCAFQVLEHVTDPRKFLEAAIHLLKQNGRLIISVPNAAAFPKYMGRENLLDQPPHHMTQWYVETFESLTSLLPLKLVRFRVEPLAEYHVDWYISILKARLMKLWLLEQPLNWAVDQLIHPLLKHSARVRSLIRGHTLYVYFKKA